ncbi:hypothetical protein EN828_17735 [Mesorhizobium sp. M2D.F.Ca.ET.185.01.1.1]|uniref:hypothetical protein n=1 Tax=unclassified Mesorhizobium TaxID=325217 RepID=UPI000FCC4926|nr:MULTISPECIES: hypothetical protein [unclassified Mesorhizobium]TGP79281.1 hypothetical protein EN870_14060 [bacterium M00.F.Ca.ET.227.01.1.1]TGQ00982.1 hypothetical protein EN864_03180 [bacterium M00.F.Ca.ET.221.01.1.1]TGQ02499.1 hypothetical protein EN865_00725 [bacterium M00.F.Ca.ET.222.01.1.1]TGU12397.1 hypothetical protein EN806_18495 [bacterium M00.F.Ca.ET.163.01.1.1]TGU34365.1 hypothetical protein EN799_20620 [bacterium M00.F.Ca.ET.156.01.1.1]TGU46328.1 hypothetical protein EN789_153
MTASLSSRIRPFDETVVFAAVDDLHGGNDRSDVAIDLQVGGGHLNVPKDRAPGKSPDGGLGRGKASPAAGTEVFGIGFPQSVVILTLVKLAQGL